MVMMRMVRGGGLKAGGAVNMSGSRREDVERRRNDNAQKMSPKKMSLIRKECVLYRSIKCREEVNQM